MTPTSHCDPKHQIETKEKKSSIFVIFGKTIIFKPFSSHGSHPFESEKVKKNKVEILSYNSSSEISYFYKNALLDVCVFVTNFLFLHKNSSLIRMQSNY